MASPTLSRSHAPGDSSRSQTSLGCATRRCSSSLMSPASMADTAERKSSSSVFESFIVGGLSALRLVRQTLHSPAEHVPRLRYTPLMSTPSLDADQNGAISALASDAQPRRAR